MIVESPRRTSSTKNHTAQIVLILFFALSTNTRAQTTNVEPRIVGPIDETEITVLVGNTHPFARPQFDEGPAPSDLPLNRMLLVLRRSPVQEVALKALLDQQQEKDSKNYHKWLTPEQFGQQFGPADQDIQTITSWLSSHGFQVERVSNGKGVIEFSGTAGQMKGAFRTEIHGYEVAGKQRWANSSDPEIPTALSPVVAGIATLHSFPRKPLYRLVGNFSKLRGETGYRPVQPKSSMSPLFNGGVNCGLLLTICYALAPYDFATIYNVLPLWNATTPIDGNGQTIAIIGQSDVYPQDISDFRSGFGLPPTTLNVILDGPDPGKLPTEGDELESDLDLEWSGAVAKGATLDFVVSASTNSSAGVDLAAEYAVDHNIAPIVSESYGACELDLGTAGNEFYNDLWEQAAAEGITVLVATGDSGSAVCDRGAPIVTDGLSVNGIASTPYNIAVGGTDFNDLQNPTIYWNSANNPTTQASAKGYIPEITWNDTCTDAEFFQITGSINAEADCNNTATGYWPSFLSPVAGSGGASNCTTPTSQTVSGCAGGYAKPTWQSGAGVPNDGKRDLPDIAMFAGDGLNANFYVVCMTDIYGGCPNDEVSNVVGIGGTSAPTPAFAGIMALVDQEAQSREGNANYVLYPLAAQTGASCNSSGSVSNSCVFYDVTAGTIAMACSTGSPDCATNVAGDQAGVLSGYTTTAGYDLATGLGSVNIASLVQNWNSVSFQPTVSTLALNPTSQITHGAPITVSVSVVPKTGSGTPTGNVSLITSSGFAAGDFTLVNGSVTSNTGLLPGGNYTVTAHYAGDGTFGASDSSPAIPVTVNPEPSTTTIQVFTLDQHGNSVPFTSGPYGGSVVYLRANVAGESGQGSPSGQVNFTVTQNGTTTNHSGDPFPLNSQGYTMTPLPGGYYQFFTSGAFTIGASFVGDSSFNPSTAPPISFTITKGQTNTATSIFPCSPSSGQCSMNFGTQVTIQATVSDNSSVFANPPTGTMTFYSDGAQLGAPVAVDSSIVPPLASFSTSQLQLGVNSITAQYNGDSNYAGSTSPANPVDMVIGVLVGLTASANNIPMGQSVTFTAQVTPLQAGGPAPTGSVQFSVNGLNFGSPVPLSGGMVQITTTSLPGGTDNIVAGYSGDANYRSSSANLTETVIGEPTFTVTANPSSIAVNSPGQSGTTELTITAQNGFSTNGPINVQPICSNLPPETTCGTVSINLSKNGTAMVALRFQTTAQSIDVPENENYRHPTVWQRESVRIAWMLLILLVLATIRLRRAPRALSFALTLALVSIFLFNAGCGGGNGGGGSNQGTPPGNYSGISVTLSINGVTQAVQDLTLTIGQ